MNLPQTFRFGDFELDLRRGELRRRAGSPIPLRPKAEALLRKLLAEPGRLFSRDELIASIWPSTVVTDDSLVQCVGELRAALEALAPKQRGAVVGHYLGGLPYAEVAVMLDTSEAAARRSAADGIANLRRRLRHEGQP